ncbi:MAG: hypothetical protein M1834_003988 [Cirrosporium novae-zelandiae]|nr:MAG: hypothetical protein M1834_003988 [Cirrosporium novae-zelandiae]
MGQSSSSQRRELTDSRRFPQFRQRNNNSSTRHRRSATEGNMVENHRHLGRFSLFPVSTSGSYRVPIYTSENGNSTTRDRILREQEERPLANMGDLDLQDTPIDNITTEPPLRRSSYMSRLGTRLLPETVARGLLSSGEETAAEGEALRGGRPSSSSMSSSDRFLPSHNPNLPNRYSSYNPTSTPTRRGSLLSRNFTSSISGPISSQVHRRLHSRSPEPNTGEVTISGEEAEESANEPTRQRRIRSRVRHSISGLSQSVLDFARNTSIRTPQRPSATSALTEANVARLGEGATEDDLERIERQHGLASSGIFDSPSPSDSGPALVDLRSLNSPGRSSFTAHGIRRFPSLFRSRSTRMSRLNEALPLSQLLAIAATAIAAQLTGHPEGGMPELEAIGTDGIDDSLQTFIQRLSDATARYEDTGATEAPTDNTPPSRNGGIHFMRAFRYVHPSLPASTESRDSGNDDTREAEAAGDSDGVDGRVVTLVIVGVQSMPEDNTTRTGNPGLVIGPPASSRTTQRYPFLRHTENRARLERQARFDNQLYDRIPTGNRPTPRSDADASLFSSTPPGPRPPPSTPSELLRSAPTSGSVTPNRRPSSASAASPFPLPSLRESSNQSEDLDTDTDTPAYFQAARQRRRSDSEYARHRDLGSGATRRNGVVAPDDTPGPTHRSWLIYVVGTNLSEDHPAFATPSLFTDNPTYEDMLLLSSLIGPVKPPVASQSELDSAGGLYRLMDSNGRLIAESINGAEPITIGVDDRCLVCLSSYEPCEEIRRLAKCDHTYHRECIDEWLTTGRNSCPLCRGQGVGEASASTVQLP